MNIASLLCYLKREFKIENGIENFILYNLKDGKNLRSLLFLEIIEKFSIKHNKNVNQFYDDTSYIVAFTLEMLQSYFLITDDIIDNSEYRRNKKCWYKQDGIGLLALKNCSSFYCLILKILVKKGMFKDVNFIYLLIKLFNECTLKTWIGQLKDSISHKITTWDDVTKIFCLEKYAKIVEYKTSAYTVRLPIQLGILFFYGIIIKERIEENEIIRLIHEKKLNQVFNDIGYFMQVQDDFLNFYPETSGKSGTDIQERKITYFSCLMVSRTIDELERLKFMRYLMYKEDDNYICGLHNKILNIIIHEYDKIESDLYSKIQKKIFNLYYPLNELFSWFLEIIYKRNI